jgi:hypothetical protein
VSFILKWFTSHVNFNPNSLAVLLLREIEKEENFIFGTFPYLFPYPYLSCWQLITLRPIYICFSSLHFYCILNKDNSNKNILLLHFEESWIQVTVTEATKLNQFFSCLSWNFEFLFFIIHLFTCAYIVWVISPPCPPTPPSPLPSRQNLFCAFPQFYWREDISNNKKDKALLLVEIKTAVQRDS